MKRIFFIFLVIIQWSTYSQDISKIKTKLDSLDRLKIELNKRISDINLEIKNVDNEINQLVKQLTIIESEKTEQVSYLYTPSYSMNLYEQNENHARGKAIITMPANQRVVVLGYDSISDHYKVKYQSYIGWGAAFQFKASSAEYDKRIQENKMRVNELNKKYGSEIAQKVLDEKIWIGMTTDMAIESWGKPSETNRDVGSWGVHEQWVYGDGVYLYFENGKLTSWQD